MRLATVSRGATLKEKLALFFVGLVYEEPPDVVRVLLHRRRFFGAAHSALSQQVMRGPSVWSIGERELFAAFVSQRNQCVF